MGYIIDYEVQMVNPRKVPAETTTDFVRRFHQIERFFSARLIA